MQAACRHKQPADISSLYTKTMEIVDERGNPIPQQQENKRVIAGILGILLGALGIHKFILGYQNEGLVMLLVSVLTCGVERALRLKIGKVHY